jgi:putative transposase
VVIALAVIDGGRHKVATVCRVLGVSRSNIAQRRSRRAHWRDRRGRPAIEDAQLLKQLRDLAAERPTYGYRRLWALLRRLRRVRGGPPVNAKRVYWLAKAHKLLLQRYTGHPPVRM